MTKYPNLIEPKCEELNSEQLCQLYLGLWIARKKVI